MGVGFRAKAIGSAQILALFDVFLGVGVKTGSPHP